MNLSKMKKSIVQLLTGVLFVSSLLFLNADYVYSQCCTNASYGQYPLTTYLPINNDGTVETITSNAYSGEYSLVQVQSGYSYTFSTNQTANENLKWASVTNADGTSCLVTGSTNSSTYTTPWVATYTGQVRLYTHRSNSCNTQGTKTFYRRVTCTAPQPPVADFSASATSGIGLNQEVTFTDASTENPTSWLWTFFPATVTYTSGSSTSQNPTVTFDDPGIYTVTLKATNSVGNDTEQKINYINSVENFYVMPSSGGASITTCANSVTDPGGNGNYPNNISNSTLTIYPETAGNKVRLTFNSFNLESCCDNLEIYDGNSTAATKIGTYNSSSPGTITSTASDGSLTLEFYSDGSLTYAGFDASISCYSDNTPSISSFTPTELCQGATVTITGTNFTGATAVSVGGTAVTSYTVNSATEISAVVGSGTTGTISVTNNEGTGTSSSSLTINSNPTLSASSSNSDICSGASVDLTATSSETLVYSLTTSGGSYPGEKWVNITTGVSGSGTVVWAQGNGEIGNNSGLLTNELIDLIAYKGQTLYLNAYDQYDDTWDGSIYELSFDGTIVINNSGATPDDGNNDDASAGWDQSSAELESSESFVVSSGSTFAWSSDVGGYSSSDQNPTGVSPSESTVYTVTETDLNGCSSTATTSVTSTSAPVITSSSTVTDATTCGVTSIDISVDTDGATGTWADGSNGLFVIGETETTNTYATNTYNSNLTLTWTNNSGVCSGSTATITAKFNQPSPTGSMDSDSWVWGGLTNSTWTTDSNWYRWESSKWVKQQVAYPDAGSKIYVLPTSDVCVSSTLNNAATSIADLNIENGGSFDLGSVNTSITGNIINNGTMQGGTGTVTLSGSSDQTISGPGTINFNNLTVNKSSGSAIISTQTDIRNTLTMTKGNIVNSQPVVIGVNSSSPGSLSHTSGIVTGELRRYFANATGSTFFPVGTSSNMRDVTINFTQAPGTDECLTVSYVAGAPVLSGANGDYSGLPLITNDDQLIQNYSADGHWNIDPTGGNYESTEINSAAYEITLHCKALTVQPTDVTKVRIIKSAGSETPILNHVSWTGLDLLSYSGDGSDFTITAAATGFSKFGAGSDDGNALPVELVSFSGACNDGVVELIWETASEYNSSHFDVENSRDGITWDVVKTIEAAGFSNELITYGYKDFHSNSGDNYYRLTQVDIDGTSKTYDVINVSCSQTTVGYFSIFPNPSSGSFQVILNNAEIIGDARMNVVDTKGNIVLSKSLDVKSGINMYVVNEVLAPGIYYVSVQNGDKVTLVLKLSVK